MDRHDPSRRYYDQAAQDAFSSQQPQAHGQQFQQQQQQSVARPRPNPQGQQGLSTRVQHLGATVPANQYRAHGSMIVESGQPTQSRIEPVTPQQYFAQNIGYGPGISPESQYVAGMQTQHEVRQLGQPAEGYGGYIYAARPDHQLQNQPASWQQASSPQVGTGETTNAQFTQPSAAQYFSGVQQSTGPVVPSNYSASQLAQQYASATQAPPLPSAAAPTTSTTMTRPIYSTGFQQPQQTQQQYSQRQQLIDLQPQQPSQQQQFVQQSTDVPRQSISQYQTVIRTIFTHVRAGALREVPQLLHDVTRYIAGNFQSLGLASDSNSKNDESNMRFWAEYNRAWLTTLQCQFDIAQAAADSRTRPQDAYLLDRDTLERLTEDLVTLCDRLEKHGLVDYQMGIAEDEIIENVLRCLSQLDGLERAARDEQADAGAVQGHNDTEEMES